jgi:hypothetical protein
VKYGLIRLVTTTADLCEQVGNVDLECPIKKGDVTITKDVDLPSQIPPVRAWLYHFPLNLKLIAYYRENIPSLQMPTPRRARRSFAWKPQ